MSESSYDLRVSPQARATWIRAAAGSGGLNFEASSISGPQLEKVVLRLAGQLKSGDAARSESTQEPIRQRYCVVASEDPLSILLLCLAALRAHHTVVLPNNLLPATLQDLRQARLDGHAPQGAHPLLDDRAVDQAMNGQLLESPPSALRAQIDGDEWAVVCFTSGSSGVPQAHHKRARQVLGEAQFIAQRWMAQPGGAVASSVPGYHLYGLLFASLAPFFAGRPLLGVLGCPSGRPAVAPPLRSLIGLGQANLLVSVPAHLQALLATEPQLLARVERVFSSAAPLPEAVGQQILALHPHPELVEVWGSTETGGVATRLNDPGGVWRPFPVLTISQDEQEQLVIHSPFAPGGAHEAYSTTDRVALHGPGFRHLGRTDGVLKVGGKRVALQDLERCARTHPQVSDVVCIALPTPGLRNQIIAMAVASQDLTVSALRSHLATYFDEVVLPRKIRILAHLPRTATGKLPRGDAEALFVFPESTTLAPLKPRALFEPVMLSPLEHIQQRLEQAGFLRFEPCASPSGHARVLQFEVSTHGDQLWFQGHFPSAAVLPGVVQLRSLVEHSARLMWPELGQLAGLRKIKFKRPIIPGDRLGVRLTHLAEKNSVQFDIQWLGSADASASPLSALLPQVFNQPAPSEASSGILTFTGKA